MLPKYITLGLIGVLAYFAAITESCLEPSDPSVVTVVEAEAATEAKDDIHWRSWASKERVVWARPNGTGVIQIPLCLPRDEIMNVKSIRFSRDGDMERAYVLVDGLPIGSFYTGGISADGKQWNVFRETKTDFHPVSLKRGRHTIKVGLFNKTDPWGLEVDRLSLAFYSQVTAEEVLCPSSDGVSQQAKRGFRPFYNLYKKN